MTLCLPRNDSIDSGFCLFTGGCQEREALDEAIVFVNDGVGQQRGVRLEAVKCEDRVVPQIGPAPQSVVDVQLPHYDNYLGIMASRFGTPTEKYGSGIEEEFRDALQRWGEEGEPWILFYFHDNPPLSKKSKDVAKYLKVGHAKYEPMLRRRLFFTLALILIRERCAFFAVYYYLSYIIANLNDSMKIIVQSNNLLSQSVLLFCQVELASLVQEILFIISQAVE